jgi:hypothetical protein
MGRCGVRSAAATSLPVGMRTSGIFGATATMKKDLIAKVGKAVAAALGK